MSKFSYRALDAMFFKYMLTDESLFSTASAAGIDKTFFRPQYASFFEMLDSHYSNPNYGCIPSIDIIMDYADNGKFGLTSETALEILKETKEHDTTDNEFAYIIDKFKIRKNNMVVSEFISGLNEQDSDQDAFKNIDSVNELFKKTTHNIEVIYKEATNAEGSIKESAQERYQTYEEIEKNPEIARGVCFNYDEIDRIMNGLKGSEFAVVAGASGSGKSMLMLNMGIRAWLGSNLVSGVLPYVEEEAGVIQETGHNILAFSIEMPKAMLERRIDSNIAAVLSNGLRDGKLDLDSKERFKKAIEFQADFGKEFYIVDVPRNVNARYIKSKYEELLPKFKPDLVLIDYMGLMVPSGVPSGQDWLDQGSVASEIHELTREYDIPIISATQLRAGDKKNGKPDDDPEADQYRIARSRMVVDNCNVIIEILQRPHEKYKRDMMLGFAKNRDGESGNRIQLWKSFETSRILDYGDCSDWADLDDNDSSDIEGLSD